MAHLNLVDENAAALKVIKTLWTPVYTAPRLTKGVGMRATQGKKAPDAEHRRRKKVRELNEELSRYVGARNRCRSVSTALLLIITFHLPVSFSSAG